MKFITTPDNALIRSKKGAWFVGLVKDLKSNNVPKEGIWIPPKCIYGSPSGRGTTFYIPEETKDKKKVTVKILKYSKEKKNSLEETKVELTALEIFKKYDFLNKEKEETKKS